MKDSKKVLAALLAVMMAASSSAVVFADEATALDPVSASMNLQVMPISSNGIVTEIYGSANGWNANAAWVGFSLNKEIDLSNANSDVKIRYEYLENGEIKPVRSSVGSVYEKNKLWDGYLTGDNNIKYSARSDQGDTTTLPKNVLLQSNLSASAAKTVDVAEKITNGTVTQVRTVVEVIDENGNSTIAKSNWVTYGTDGTTSAPKGIGDESIVKNYVTNHPESMNDAVASIGDRQFISLEAALTAATDGETITLMSDVKLDKMLVINKDITLDLNNNTITASDNFKGTYDNDKHLIQVYKADDVTIQNGKIETTNANKHGIDIYGSSNVTLKDLTVDSSASGVGSVFNPPIPVNINGSSVFVEGTLELKPLYDFSSPIGVGKGSESGLANPTLTFNKDSKIEYNGKASSIVKVDAENGFKPSESTIKNDSQYIDMKFENGNFIVTQDPDGDGGSSGGNGGGSIGVPGTGTPIGTGTWKQSPAGWWYQNPDGTYPANQWKYLDSGKGYKAWYLFNQNGYITFGWQKVGNTWYYMNRSGEMQTGWQFINNKWYYLNSNGAMATGWVKDGNKWYFMNKDGSMHFGWLSWAGYWYHLDSHGVMSTGWKQVNGKWYYMYAENGRMAANTTTPDGYRVGPDGAWVK
ncbi:MAG: hypothetical protein ACOX60_06670 [Massiliimalia sp.]